ncbi:GntR family transcriptional regulator [Pseudoxanthomonas wuyuanensis]|uniref:DNA-binding transcriptional regulator, GntR family n=1 Tax=Pseudoxanthomonas wuyuanensis TaxID=1073196 RepID=A0A286DBK8_9GAMM|nr:GntR family transcriptional regulator [Pseudoxanthomonas wuyuanensis]KAF1721720.1 GntR family transcriptional regulator [Pseudoxanthomonas wuyuanensis]SOD56040.1 DNA-binding transcriptional regulator, GntR family [Pseudoxanthomonas wuyuanensis]
MSGVHSKSAFLYAQIRRSLQSGRYVPGQRIDPATLAAEFKTSATPVRFALYRLVGEGQVADHARAGLHVPLPNEIALRDLYDWMERLLLMACDIGIAPVVRKPVKPELSSADDDLVKLTWQLFDAIAQATAHRSLHLAVRQANDRLAPIRRAKRGLFEHAYDELAELIHYWHKPDIPALKSALRGYHERRKQRVPCIVARLSEEKSVH